jgi:hypothetical protein
MIGANLSWGGKTFEITGVLPYDGWFNWDAVFSSWELPYSFSKPGKEGYHDMENGGVWVPGEPTIETKNAVILPLTPKDLKYDLGGSYTRQDVKIYIKCPDNGFRIYLATRISEGV